MTRKKVLGTEKKCIEKFNTGSNYDIENTIYDFSKKKRSNNNRTIFNVTDSILGWSSWSPCQESQDGCLQKRNKFCQAEENCENGIKYEERKCVCGNGKGTFECLDWNFRSVFINVFATRLKYTT